MRLVFKVLIFFFIIYTGFMVYIVVKSMENAISSVRYCETPNDCVEVKASCCGCAEGGENTCINSNVQEAWEADLLKDCRDTYCVQLYNCVPSECACINNTCILKKI